MNRQEQIDKIVGLCEDFLLEMAEDEDDQLYFDPVERTFTWAERGGDESTELPVTLEYMRRWIRQFAEEKLKKFRKVILYHGRDNAHIIFEGDALYGKWKAINAAGCYEKYDKDPTFRFYVGWD